MKSKNKIVTIGIILTTLVLAGIAIFTAIRLYQTRNVAPTDSSAAAGPKVCQISFTITGVAPKCYDKCDSDSQCPTGLKCIGEELGAQKYCVNTRCISSTSCVCATVTPTATATATATPRVAACNEVCNVTINPPISCEGDLSCYSTSDLVGASGLCRNLDCTDETDCGCPEETETPTPTATATATANPQCNNSCTENTDCPNGLMCNIPSGATSGSCRNTSCLSETDCTCPVATATSVANEPQLPSAGTSWPTVLGTAFGFLVILGSLLLVF